MKIQIEGTLLIDAVKTLRNLIGGSTIFLEVTSNFLKLSATNNGNSFLTSVPLKILEKSKRKTCALDSTALATALTKLKDVVFKISESSLTITSGRYTAEIITHQFEAQQVVPESEKTKGLSIKSSFLEKIVDLVPKLELQPLLSTYDYVPFGIKVTKEGAFLASFDFYQAAFVNTEDIKGNLEFVMPNNIFSTLAKEIKGQDYKLLITDSTIYAYNDVFEYAAAMPQSDGNTVSFSDMQDLYASLKGMVKKDGVSVKLSAESINQMLENGKAIYEKDSTFEFKIVDDKCRLELKSSSGKISTTILLAEKASKNVTFSCDFHFFSSIMKKAGSTIQLKVIPDKMLLFTNKPVIFMMGLS